jgi:hypothetical protein
MAKIYTEQEKQAAATELENARQNIRILGPRATNTDRKRVEKAEKQLNKVLGK